MDKNLFEKYSKKIDEQKNKKEDILTLIENQTGIHLTNEEIVLENKNITFQTSSVKKTALHNKKIRDYLTERGYSISF